MEDELMKMLTYQGEIVRYFSGPNKLSFAKSAPLIITTVALLVLLYPALGICDWDEASRVAVSKIQETHELSQVPELVFADSQANLPSEALTRSLTKAGYRLAASGQSPRVEVTRSYLGENRFWERPYKSYVLEVRVLDRGKIIHSHRAVDVDRFDSPYQIPVRIFLALFTGGFIYWIIFQAGAYRKSWAWMAGGLLWILFLGFLAQGWFVLEIFM